MVVFLFTPRIAVFALLEKTDPAFTVSSALRESPNKRKIHFAVRQWRTKGSMENLAILASIISVRSLGLSFYLSWVLGQEIQSLGSSIRLYQSPACTHVQKHNSLTK
ncbi:hypothetical protein RRG08_016479 [Elysia crispata]|uniref:Uncharacterized protein n=1 Tax=Elysia crispata TaxID=231223 RepID=A0AAE0Y8V2_9GAST|nr:hypothetical protein RRG08_016479 [Elysia crispata]